MFAPTHTPEVGKNGTCIDGYQGRWYQISGVRSVSTLGYRIFAPERYLITRWLEGIGTLQIRCIGILGIAKRVSCTGTRVLTFGNLKACIGTRVLGIARVPVPKY